LLWVILNRLLWWVTLNCPHCGSEKNVPADSTNNLLKGALQSDLRMCTKKPTFYDSNSLTMFWVLAKPDCCFLIIYYILEAWKYK
jgi:hypothetical protein